MFNFQCHKELNALDDSVILMYYKYRLLLLLKLSHCHFDVSREYCNMK
jgi:hypothetical protein